MSRLKRSTIPRPADTDVRCPFMPFDQVVAIFNAQNPDQQITRKYATVIISNARRKILPKLREVLEWYEKEKRHEP